MFASSYNSAFDPPQTQPAQKVAPGVANGPPGQQPAPFTQNGPSAAQEQRQVGAEQQPAFSEQRTDAPVDPRAPRKPEGIQDWNEEEEDNRWGGDKGRGRGRGGGGRR